MKKTLVIVLNLLSVVPFLSWCQGKVIEIREESGFNITALTFSFKENLLVTGAANGVIKIWELKDNNPFKIIIKLPGAIKKMALTKDEKYLGVLHSDTVYVYNFPKGNLYFKYQGWKGLGGYGYKGKIFDFSFSDENQLLFASTDEKLLYDDLNDASMGARCFNQIFRNADFLRHISGTHTFITHEPQTNVFRICDTHDGATKRKLKPPDGFFAQSDEFNVSPSGKYVVWALRNGTITWENLDQNGDAKYLRNEDAKHSSFAPAVKFLSFSPDDRLIAVTQTNGKVKIFERISGNQVTTYSEAGVISRCEFSPNGKYMVLMYGGGLKLVTMR